MNQGHRGPLVWKTSLVLNAALRDSLSSGRGLQRRFGLKRGTSYGESFKHDMGEKIGSSGRFGSPISAWTGFGNLDQHVSPQLDQSNQAFQTLREGPVDFFSNRSICSGNPPLSHAPEPTMHHCLEPTRPSTGKYTPVLRNGAVQSTKSVFKSECAEPPKPDISAN